MAGYLFHYYQSSKSVLGFSFRENSHKDYSSVSKSPGPEGTASSYLVEVPYKKCRNLVRSRRIGSEGSERETQNRRRRRPDQNHEYRHRLVGSAHLRRQHCLQADGAGKRIDRNGKRSTLVTRAPKYVVRIRTLKRLNSCGLGGAWPRCPFDVTAPVFFEKLATYLAPIIVPMTIRAD